MITTDLLVGVVLTALAYAGLMWAVVRGKHVVERVKRGEYPHHPNPERRPADDGPGSSPAGRGPDEAGGRGRGEAMPRE